MERHMAIRLNPVGSEFQVNQDAITPGAGVTFDQFTPDIAPLTDGRFAASYTTQVFSSPSTDWDIYGQFLNSNGTRSGPTVFVSIPFGFQDNSAVAPRTDAGFTTVFEDYGTGGTFNHSDIRAVSTSAAGTPGSTIPIATFSNSTVNPDIALLQDGSGRQLITYQYNFSSTDHDIYWNILNPNGTTLFLPTAQTNAQAVSNDIFDQQFPVVAAAGDTALVVYQDTAGSLDQFISARLFNDGMNSFGPVMGIAGHSGGVIQPDVAGLAGGNYVITYNYGGDIYGRIFDPILPGGSFLGPEFRIDAQPGGAAGDSRVYGTMDGGFIAVWDDVTSVGSGFDVHARRFDSHGTPFGDDFIVNTSTDQNQEFPALAVDGNNVMVTWQDNGSRTTDPDPSGIRARAFTAPAFDYDSARYGDFSPADSRADILFQSDNPSAPALIFQTNSSGAFASNTSLGLVPSGYRIDGTGNFNSTAGDDILLRSPNSVAVWVMNGTTPQPVAVLGGTSPQWLNSGIGDFTGDGQSDLLFRNPGTNEIATWGVANNQLSTTPKVLGSTSSQYHIVAVDDFTGDHQADILFRHDNGDIAIWRIANNALAGTPAVVGSTSTSYHVVGDGDFDGNGANDILFRNDNGDLAMWLLNSQGQLLGAPTAIGNAGLQYHVDGTGDLNGDGRSDIVFRDAGGTLVEWLMNGTTFAAPPSAFAANTVDYSIAAHHFDLV
jgi:hypothetical protein